VIKVAIIEDHQILVDALELMLQRDQEFSFVGAAHTIRGGLDLIQRTQPDVLLLDIQLPDGNGYELVPRVIDTSPNTHVVVLTSYTDEETILRAVELGVSGFLPKSASLKDFFQAIRRAAEGEMIMPPNLLIGLLRRTHHESSATAANLPTQEILTRREFQILTCLAAGKSGNTIATELEITPLTVRTHVRNLMSKLGVHSRLEAVAFGVKHGMIQSSR
jgi:DNA-binding NarL/FixJ family response regulator